MAIAVFCSISRLVLGRLLFKITFNWRIIGDFSKASCWCSHALCIMLNGLMLEVGTVKWMLGLFDVVCDTLKLALIDFFCILRFSTVLVVGFCCE